MTAHFNPRSGLVIVRAHIWGPTGDLSIRVAVDTGASFTVIDPGRLIYVGYDPAAILTRTQIATASGIEYAPRVPVAKFAAIGQETSVLSVLAHSLPPAIKVDGLLGLDFMREQRLTIDFRSGVLSLA